MIAINMEMPKSCAECHIGEVDCKHKKTAFVRYSRGDFARPFDCPLTEIVTCKDCIHRDEYECRHGHPNCKDNFYCSDGERRE